MGCLLAKLLAVRFPITGLACQLPTLYCAILPSALTNQRAQVEVLLSPNRACALLSITKFCGKAHGAWMLVCFSVFSIHCIRDISELGTPLQF